MRWLQLFLSERSQLVAFTLMWVLLVLIPMIGVVIFSFLKGYGLRWNWEFTLRAYENIILTGRWEVLWRTMEMAAVVTSICLLIGFPFALWLAKRARSEWVKQFTWLCMTIPFFLDPSARTLVWRAVLGAQGLVNDSLMRLGLIDTPIASLLYSNFAVGFGLVAPYFPNMVWPVYLAILLIDDDLIAAARDLGATPWQILRDIILPLAMPGIAAGLIFTFVPILGDNVVTHILGGGMKEYLADSVSSLVTSMNYSGAAAFATLVLLIAMLLAQLLWLFRAIVMRCRRGQI